MERFGLIAAALIAVSAPASASGDELRPVDSPAEPRSILDPGEGRPLTIAIESGIQFSMLGLRGKYDGDAAIDPQTGQKRVGPQMIDLGGMAFQGKAKVTGDPLRPVRIDMPPSVTLRSPSGDVAELTDFRTDLNGVALLDANGELVFNFGATLTSKEAAGGNFRGRIPIRVEYF